MTALRKGSRQVIPYLVTFLISILLCTAGEWILSRNGFFGRVVLVPAVFAPVVLAGARGYSVGTDVGTYGNYVFEGACTEKYLVHFLNTRKQIEPLYKALAFAVSRFTNNAHWFYFVTALIICGFTMLGLMYYRRWCSLTLGWMCFLFLFYGDTLNTMRQCLALALVFAAFPLFLEKKYIRYVILQTAAVLFHVTGVLALCFPVIYLLLKRVIPRWLQFFLLVGCMAAVLFYSPVLQIALDMKLLPAKFSRYVAEGIAFALNPTILRLPFLIPILYYYDRFCDSGKEQIRDLRLRDPEKRKKNPFLALAHKTAVYGLGVDEGTGDVSAAEQEKMHVTGMFIVIMLVLDVCTVQLRSVRPALFRISFYFGYYRYIAYSRLVRILRRDNRAAAAVILILYLCIIWYYQNVIQGNNQIFPYVYEERWYRQTILLPLPE